MQSTQATSNMSSVSKFIKTSSWDTQALRYMQPRLTDRGLKTVAVISTQKNKKLHIQLPSMTCWGITDFTDQSTGESDGKFSIKLHFTGKGNLSEASAEALEKLKAFEEQVLTDAVNMSEAWFGKKQTREIVEYGYFPFLKPGKNSETKQVDPEKGIYFRPKVNCYSEKWDVEVFDVEGNMLFPSENGEETPMDFVPAGSEVTCGVECKHIWIGAKGWGISWALKQSVVIPKMTENTAGKLMLDLSEKEKTAMYNAPAPSVPEPEDEVEKEDQPAPATTYVEDSDDDVPASSEEVVQEEEPKTEPVPKSVVKKAVVKKAAASTEEADTPPPAPVKKKTVVRKKAA
jgi:hypothetical protein